MKPLTIKNLNDYEAAADELLHAFPNNRFFCLQGEMGAGKTTFIKAICKRLGVMDNTSSPTYSLINEYIGDHQQKIFHFDFYRIKNIEEAYDIGYEDYFYSGAYCFIEWPEKIESLIPDDAIKISIQIEPQARLITATGLRS